jgi:membrane fusion protein, multidrug efflux system
MAKTKTGRSSAFYAVGVGSLLVAMGTVIYFHVIRDQSVASAREARAIVSDRGPRVEFITATAGPTERTIRLLGDVRSGATAVLYAKVAGYMKEIFVDKGDKVETGQVLAEIESPEVEQQFAAASADLANKRRNLARIKELFSKGNTTQVALYNAETEVAVSENNVGVLATSVSYKTVRAPFAGRVTARFVDPGALVTNSQTNITSAMPMMTLSDDTRVRVFTYVQQIDVPFVQVGNRAVISDASNPERNKVGTVTRMTGELEPRTRTMLIEIHLDNADQFFTPGSFAYVTLHVPIASFVQIPVSGLITRGEENIVGILENEVVRFRTVKVASTDGATVSLTEGLKAGERVVINLPNEVTNGSRVQPVTVARNR